MMNKWHNFLDTYSHTRWTHENDVRNPHHMWKYVLYIALFGLAWTSLVPSPLHPKRHPFLALECIARVPFSVAPRLGTVPAQIRSHTNIYFTLHNGFNGVYYVSQSQHLKIEKRTKDIRNCDKCRLYLQNYSCYNSGNKLLEDELIEEPDGFIPSQRVRCHFSYHVKWIRAAANYSFVLKWVNF